MLYIWLLGAAFAEDEVPASSEGDAEETSIEEAPRSSVALLIQTRQRSSSVDSHRTRTSDCVDSNLG